jgi:hypothetical protein
MTQFTLMPSTCIRSSTSCLNPYCCPVVHAKVSAVERAAGIRAANLLEGLHRRSGLQRVNMVMVAARGHALALSSERPSVRAGKRQATSKAYNSVISRQHYWPAMFATAMRSPSKAVFLERFMRKVVQHQKLTIKSTPYMRAV